MATPATGRAAAGSSAPVDGRAAWGRSSGFFGPSLGSRCSLPSGSSSSTFSRWEHRLLSTRRRRFERPANRLDPRLIRSPRRARTSRPHRHRVTAKLVRLRPGHRPRSEIQPPSRQPGGPKRSLHQRRCSRQRSRRQRPRHQRHLRRLRHRHHQPRQRPRQRRFHPPQHPPSRPLRLEPHPPRRLRRPRRHWSCRPVSHRPSRPRGTRS